MGGAKPAIFIALPAPGQVQILPVITAIGMDPIHFGVMMVVNLAIGFVTPPVGVNLYVASSLSETPVLSVARHALPYIAMFLLALLLITFIPSLSLVFVG